MIKYFLNGVIDMICPKCRKNYSEGIEICPKCQLKLIALMGDADAPMDEKYDNISDLERAFGTEQFNDTIKLTDENEYQLIDDVEPLNDEIIEEEFVTENTAEAEEETAAEVYELPAEEYCEEVDDESMLVSASDESFDDEYTDDEAVYYGENEDNISNPVAYEEEYEVDFSDDEYVYESNEEEYEETDDNIEEKENPDNSPIVYKSSADSKKAKKEAVTINEKSTKLLTFFIFAVAVIMIIASVVCFALGNTTELTEMNIESIFIPLFVLLN